MSPWGNLSHFSPTNTRKCLSFYSTFLCFFHIFLFVFLFGDMSDRKKWFFGTRKHYGKTPSEENTRQRKNPVEKSLSSSSSSRQEEETITEIHTCENFHPLCVVCVYVYFLHFSRCWLLSARKLTHTQTHTEEQHKIIIWHHTVNISTKFVKIFVLSFSSSFLPRKGLDATSLE